MYPLSWEQEFARERMAEARADADMRRLIRSGRTGITLRARVARKLLEAAMIADGEETWRIVWEGLRTPGGSPERKARV